jgi:hypothetical protein
LVGVVVLVGVLVGVVVLVGVFVFVGVTLGVTLGVTVLVGVIVGVGVGVGVDTNGQKTLSSHLDIPLSAKVLVLGLSSTLLMFAHKTSLSLATVPIF